MTESQGPEKVLEGRLMARQLAHGGLWFGGSNGPAPWTFLRSSLIKNLIKRWRIVGFLYHSRSIPGASIVFFVCQALILLGAYQGHQELVGNAQTRPKHFLWFCKEKSQETVEPLVQDLQSSKDLKRH